MKMTKILIALSLLLSPVPFAQGEAYGKDAKEDCSYCAGMEKLKSGFAKVKPDAMNEKTIDRQNELVDSSADLLKPVMKDVAKLSAEDWKRILSFLGIVVRYDYQNLVADELLPVMGPGRETFFSELKKAEKAGTLKQADADEIRVSFGTAEAIQERGNDE
jgi:hypothetical protein